MLPVTQLKIGAAFTLLGIAVLFGLLPLCILSRSSTREPSQRAWLSRLVGWLNAFAGGVFMGIALIHLLPEARELLTEAFQKRGEHYHFNWTELIVACGFFLVVFVQQIIFICEERLGSGREDSDETAFADKEGTENVQSYTSDDDSKKPAGSESKSKDDHHSLLPARVTTFSAVILLVSLSIHSIFEGLAIGLQLTYKNVVDIFIAIALHKGIEAFTISFRFAQTYASRTVKGVYCAVFALMSPLGIAIGIPVAYNTRASGGVEDSSRMINGVLQAIATGTFMFVTFVEILPRELQSRRDGLLKFAFIVVGFAAISALNLLEHGM